MSAIGLVGYGRWGKNIFRDLRSLGAEVHVAVPSGASRSAARAAGAASVVGAANELPVLDGYVAAVPTVLHAAVVRDLLPRERPIFVEKPLCDDPAEAAFIAGRGAGRVFVMDKWRYHPGIRGIAGLARSGELGEVVAIRTYRLGWGNPHRDVDAVWILLPHDLSIVLEILGRIPEPAAAASLVPGREGSDLLAELGGGGDVRVVIEVSANHPSSRRAVVVTGTKATAQLADSYDDRIFIAADGAPPREVMVGSELPLIAELGAFLDHVRGGPPPRSSAGDGLLVVERVAALRRLAKLS